MEATLETLVNLELHCEQPTKSHGRPCGHKSSFHRIASASATEACAAGQSLELVAAPRSGLARDSTLPCFTMQSGGPAPGGVMTKFQPATQRTDAIIRPSCPNCGTRMMLSRIEPDSPGYVKHTFECSNCNHEISEIANSTELRWCLRYNVD